MKTHTRIHFTIAAAFNLILVLKMLSIGWDGNDKAIILVLFGYSILILLNLITWLALKKFKKTEYSIYKTTTIGLLILFIPTITAASIY